MLPDCGFGLAGPGSVSLVIVGAVRPKKPKCPESMWQPPKLAARVLALVSPRRRSQFVGALTAPIPISISARCVAVKRFANCAVVVDAGVGTGSSCCPAVSARWWSIPTRKSEHLDRRRLGLVSKVCA